MHVTMALDGLEPAGPRSSRCPLCGMEFRRESSPAFPFCSFRCKWIDLGKWLSEEYGVPPENPDADPEPP
jgi:hypothetical protein